MSTIAAWKEAARSARRSADPARAELRQRKKSAVFRPVKEKSRPGSRASRRATRKPPVAPRRQPFERGAAGVAEAEQARRPCRRPRRRRRRGSGRAARSPRGRAPRPAACGRRWRADRGTAAPAARARGSWRRRGPAGGRPGSAAAAAAAAIALAVLTPTRRAPISPGPAVTATASISSRVDAASASAASTTGAASSRWWRAATSGTTPPKPRVRRGLRGDHVGEDARAVENGGAGVVAGRLDRQDQAAQVQPHDQRVLAVVVVIAGTDAGRAEAEALVHVDRLAVGDPHLERERQLPAAPPRTAAAAAGRRRRRRGLRRDGDVHQVPDLVVAGADHVAEQLLAGAGREADPGGLGELEDEHRQRPGGREGAALDRDHGRQVAVGEPATLTSWSAHSALWKESRSRHRSASGGLR